MLEPRYSTMVGGGGSAAGGGSTQRLLEAAAAANAAQHHHEQQQQAAAAVAAAANANRLSLSSEHAAIDLSRKSVAAAAAVSDDVDVEESDDEAPLDLKVRPSSSSHVAEVPEFTAVPNPEQRAELLRIAELYTSAASAAGPPANATPLPPQAAVQVAQSPPQPQHASRDSSQDRADDSIGGDSPNCGFCGADSTSPDFVPADHRSGACSRGSIACTLCAKTFTLYSHYEAHKKCHQKLKQRQYPCQTCGKIFTSASNRNMHQRIHKGVRPFQCTPCGVFFRQKAHLQKHQKTQGHVQATELYEKKRRENKDEQSNVPPAVTTSLDEVDDERISDEDNTSNGEVAAAAADSTQSPTHQSAADSPLDSNANNSGRASRSKSSPKRKQPRPRYHSARSDDGPAVAVSAAGDTEDRVRSFVDYNDVTHGYECRQCAFGSHDLAVLKGHVKDEHLSVSGDLLRCPECQIGFSKEFNLRIHNRKHETSSQFLPCDHCEQVFKVPNKLIKHMEGVHSVCPTCGDRQEDKAALVRHQQEEHSLNGDNGKKGFHANLLQFTPLNQLSPGSSSSSSLKSHLSENRAAKMRKLDVLAEVIRQKQLLSTTQHPTSALNGNDITVRDKSPAAAASPRRRKNDLRAATKEESPSAASTTASASVSGSGGGFLFDPSKLTPVGMQDLLRKSENNNILSSLKLLPPTVRLPTQPVAGLTPPSSPPLRKNHRHQHHSEPSAPTPMTTQIRGELTIVGPSDDSDDQEETGLDLSLKRKEEELHRATTTTGGSSSDENEVSTTVPPPPPPMTARPPVGASPFPPFPFFGGLLPPPPHVRQGAADPALAEHLMKLSGLPVPPPPPPPLSAPPPQQDKSSSSLAAAAAAAAATNPYTVLSAMLGHHPPPPTFHQPVFPGMAPAPIFPPAAATAASINGDSNESSSKTSPKISKAGQAEGGKPFQCSYCSKEFSHLSSLESHLEHVHSGESKHVCDTCGKNFSSKSNLTAHKKIHSGERPFECLICHKRFRQKAHLQKHETTHSSATPYQCTVCEKAFGHPSNLNTHMATHSSVRPYHCSDCGKSYKDSASFKRHRLGHTGERPYPCSLCPDGATGFIDSKSLRRHRQLAHPNVAATQEDLDSVGGDDEEEEEEIDDDEDDVVGRSRDDHDTSGSSSMNLSSSSDKREAHPKPNNNTSSSAYSSFESRDEEDEDVANRSSSPNVTSS